MLCDFRDSLAKRPIKSSSLQQLVPVAVHVSRESKVSDMLDLRYVWLPGLPGCLESPS